MTDLSMLPDFIAEAMEHLEELETSLLRLEQNQDDKYVLNDIFRSMHTIKGAAQFVGIDRISELSHKLENLLDLIRRGEQRLDEELVDMLIEGKDRIALLVVELEQSQREETVIADLILLINQRVDGSSETEADTEKAPAVAEQEECSTRDSNIEISDEEEKHSSLDDDEGAFKCNDDDLEDVLDSLFSEDSPVAKSEGESVALPVSDDRDKLEGVLDSALGDAFDESPGTTGQDAAALKNEASEEEHDEELLEIFLKQLQENIPFLHSQITELATSVDKQDVLNRCSKAIKTLHSSANYMGYEKLTQHYTTWQEEIDVAGAQLSKGHDPDLYFMQNRIDEVIGAYPQAIEDACSCNDGDLEDVLDSFFSEDSPVAKSEGESVALPVSNDRYNLEAVLDSALGDAFDESPGTTGPDAAALENEASEEEHDEELLEIFLKQLQENIPFLHSQITELATSVDKQDVLNRCSKAIKTLHSSANYMGYEKLTQHYTTWQEEIDVAGANINNGQNPDLYFMQSRIDEVIGAYPQAMEDEPQKEISKTTQQAHETVNFDSDDEFEDITDTIGSMLSAPPVSADEVDATTSAVESTADGGSVAAEKEVASTPLPDSDGEDQELFNKLSFALDASLEQAENVPLKPMHGVIEEMITHSTEEVVEEEVSRAKLPVANMEQVEAKTFTEQPDLQKEKEQVQEGRIAKEETSGKKIKQSLRVDADKIDFMMNQVGELVVSRAYIAQLFAEMRGLQQNLVENSGLTKSEIKPLNEFAFRLGEAGVALGRVSNELQEGIMKVRMLPIDQLFKRFPRLVRDLIHKTDKQIKLETKGEETELDRMVIEEISDPLIHIIRNAVDHGIETAEERKRLGKPERGTLTLEAYHESDHIVIEVTDDGRGLNIERLKTKALSESLYSSIELDRMSNTELMHLVMQPGFSTAEQTTKTSGRGVGMDVVKKNIEKLNGSVEIETKTGRGTRIRIKIPLTMAIIQALMVRVGAEKFTIPLRAVEETLRIFQQEISEIEGIDVIHLRDTTMPIFRLSKLFGVKRAAEKLEKLFVVVVKTGMQTLGLVVDELLGQEEVVIKPLADYLRQDSGFAGATILGDGGISLILDIPELIRMTTDKQIIKQKRLSNGRRIAINNDKEQQAQVIH